MRTHLIPTAGYWYDAAKKKQQDGMMPEAMMAMEQAYNQVENALSESVNKELLAEKERLLAFLKRCTQPDIYPEDWPTTDEWRDILKEGKWNL